MCASRQNENVTLFESMTTSYAWSAQKVRHERHFFKPEERNDEVEETANNLNEAKTQLLFSSLVYTQATI